MSQPTCFKYKWFISHSGICTYYGADNNISLVSGCQTEFCVCGSTWRYCKFAFHYFFDWRSLVTLMLRFLRDWSTWVCVFFGFIIHFLGHLTSALASLSKSLTVLNGRIASLDLRFELIDRIDVKINADSRIACFDSASWWHWVCHWASSRWCPARVGRIGRIGLPWRTISVASRLLWRMLLAQSWDLFLPLWISFLLALRD